MKIYRDRQREGYRESLKQYDPHNLRVPQKRPDDKSPQQTMAEYKHHAMTRP